jgi:DNA-binding response OmpR family regulator
MDRCYRLLLVEDDRYLRRAAAVTLQRAGYAVTTAVDGEQALAAVREQAPDLVLLDLIMPKIQGFEVLERLKADAATAPIPVIVLSNLGQEGDRERALRVGARDYLVKADLSLAELSAAVGRVLAREAA